MDNTTPTISILIPIYNVETCLEQCLSSVVCQTFKDLEIICLNDGSTDNSERIINEFAANDSRIVVINKENSGYGDSMNIGLSKARGEYIGIVESDDWAEPDMFEQLYNLAKKFDADAVKSNFYYYHGGTNTNVKADIINLDEVDQIINPTVNPHILLQQASIWAGLYKREFLENNSINFLSTPGASFQDTSFNYKVWTSTKRAAYTADAFLHYRIDNENSSVKSKEKAYFVCNEIDEMYRYTKAQGTLNELNAVLTHRTFDIYYWNLGRLQGKLAYEFLERMTKEFNDLKDEGLLNDKLLSSRDKLILRQIMQRPKTFMLVRKLRKPYQWLKRRLRKD